MNKKQLGQVSTKVTPYMAMFGRPPKLFCEIATEAENQHQCKHSLEKDQDESHCITNSQHFSPAKQYVDILSKFETLNETIRTNI